METNGLCPPQSSKQLPNGSYSLRLSFSANPTKAICQRDILGGSGDGVCSTAGLVLAVTNERGVEAGGAPLYLRNGKYSELVDGREDGVQRKYL